MTPQGIRISTNKLASVDRAETLTFAGDYFTFPGSARPTGVQILHPHLKSILDGSVLGIVNFEAPVTDASAGVLKSGPRLKQDSQSLRVLSEMGFNALCLANNHVMDYGAAGLQSTLAAAAADGFICFGAGPDRNAACRHQTFTTPNGVKIALFSFAEHEFGIAEAESPGAAGLQPEIVEHLVRQAKTTHHIVIVCSHGGIEMLPFPPVPRRAQLRRLIDAGADVVIGHHAHVAQGWEQYRNGLIFYSLGDFYFDAHVPGYRKNPMRDWGLLVRVAVGRSGLHGAEVVPFVRTGDVLEPPACNCLQQRLVELSDIASSAQLEVLWRAAAVDLFLGNYRDFFPQILPVVRTWAATVRSRVGQTLECLRLLARIWSGEDSDTVPPYPAGRLTFLNLLRCESHRWLLETALMELARPGFVRDQAASATIGQLRDLVKCPSKGREVHSVINESPHAKL